MKTTDGGKTWTEDRPIDDGGNYVSVCLASDKQGWVADELGHVAITTDGGKRWKPAAIGTDAGVLRLKFRSPKLGYAVSRYGTVLKYTMP